MTVQYIKLLFAALIFSVSTSAEPIELNRLQPSVYIGIANGTNTGGVYGIGTEIRLYEFLAVNGSLGITPLNKIDDVKYDYDIGIKIYHAKHFYLGFNYGIVEVKYRKHLDSYVYDYIKSGSITFGYKTPDYKNFYASAFLGATFDSEANSMKDFGGEVFTPRIGLLVGYILLKDKD